MFQVRSFSTTAVLLFSGIAGSVSLHAASVYVGTCGSPHQTTIQAAVNASAAGGTVIVCPGTYPEQVKITKNLTVTGAAVGNANSSIITAPVGGVVVNTSDLYQPSSYPVAAQILVQNATVSLSNLTVDGNGNGIATCATDLRGIYYQNASGSISNVAVHNQVLATGYTGCQSGQGIFAQSGYGATTKQSVSIVNSSVRNFQKNGITADGNTLTVAITSNYIVGQGPTTGAAENGIQVSDGTQGSVSTNTVIDEIWEPDTSSDTGDAASGILIYASEKIQIIGNTVGSTQFGIVTVSDPTFGVGDYTVIQSNQILGTKIFDGIDACSNYNTVDNNVVFSSTESAIHLDSTCTSTGKNNKVFGNVINDTCAGVLEGVTTGNTIGSNSYANANSQVLAGNTCTAAVPALVTAAATAEVTTALNSTATPRPTPVR